MNYDQKRGQWVKFVCGDASPAEEAEVVKLVEEDSTFLSAAMLDLELDSLLRESHRPSGDSGRFVGSVLEQLDWESPATNSRTADPERLPLVSTRYPVEPPPRVITDQDLPSAILDAAIVPPVVTPTQPRSTPLRREPKTNAYVWRTFVAPLAAVTLVAVTVAIYLESKRMTARQEAAIASEGRSSRDVTSDVASESQGLDAMAEETAIDERNGATLAETSDASNGMSVAIESTILPSQPSAMNSQSDAGESDQEVVVEAGVDRSDFGGLVSVSDQTSDVLWYRRPLIRELGETLCLDRGEVELEFASGAKLTVRSPANFVIDSSNSLLLAHGRVTAFVPKKAIGFTIDTPSMQIVDLGTRFETEVSRTGAVGVHVLEGKVLLKSVGKSGGDQQNWTLQKGDRKFADADGHCVDWRVDVTANVFGEIKVLINGQQQASETADEIEAIAKHPIFDAMARGIDEGFEGRYVFNGEVREYGNDSGDVTRIIEDLSVLAEMAKRANEIDGAYRIKDKQYHYENLREQLEARRRVARIHGSRALGGQFRPREMFESEATDCDRLEALQRNLIRRLAYVDLGATGRGAQATSDLRLQVPRSVPPPVDRSSGSEAQASASASDGAAEAELSGMRDQHEERDALNRTLEQMILRKRSNER
ncbi:MAG: FecR domain-containing protein [Rubripirellula sp.]